MNLTVPIVFDVYRRPCKGKGTRIFLNPAKHWSGRASFSTFDVGFDENNGLMDGR
jgi:hypothetical protein